MRIRKEKRRNTRGPAYKRKSRRPEGNHVKYASGPDPRVDAHRGRGEYMSFQSGRLAAHCLRATDVSLDWNVATLVASTTSCGKRLYTVVSPKSDLLITSRWRPSHRSSNCLL